MGVPFLSLIRTLTMPEVLLEKIALSFLSVEKFTSKEVPVKAHLRLV